MNGWSPRKLGEVLDVHHGWAFKGEYFSESGELIVLTPGNFKERGGFKPKNGAEKFYSGDFPEKFLLPEGAVVVAMTEQAQGLLGSSATIPESNRYLHNQRIGLLEVTNPEALDLRFAYHLMNTPDVRQQIQATSTGSKVRHTAPDRIRDVIAVLPSLPTQRTVASVLDSVEDLIANNRRRVELLEEMERTIYREWFVKFRYPGHEDLSLVDSPLGPIPAGWSVRRLAECCDVFVDGDWVETKDQGGADYRLLQVSNIGLGKFRETGAFRYITQETFERLRCTAVEAGDLLISRMPDPVGRAWLVDHLEEPAITVVDVTLARPKSKAIGHYLSQVLNAREQLAHAETVATGTTRKRITRRVLGQLAVRVPSDDLLERFHQTTEGCASLMTHLRRENDRLGRLRDLLLPKLVTGQIDVSALDLDALGSTTSSAGVGVA